ncbi:Interferon-inducible double stranded RNA-dependent protein kinase activator A [Eufriesea mexicana]|uniref:Interferon-inducible double stranded RNA-dependent protein kinase activator A n=1 Tax=Eufriesea mexicana TaxID=516756 RepID=A0A310SJL1_9HYME|nr:PREDICTED: interferon-inducible double-stranded RNA-dependent protein kinase activator A homolog [Eufriesea mexicana]OAD53780.1 Interferon-inducible double stranded RNA-dependent protein kinase activator A [Eufriesea mexicana]
MSKTPVSILQEMMIKNLTVPTYELIHNGGGSHMNSFTYQVTCNELTATGVGRSKKDAKHEAAKAMLETIAAHRGYLQLPPSTEQTSVRTPLPPIVPEVERIPPDVPFVNAIGDLQTLCVENKLQYPIYDTISDVGPPHDKTFTIQCEVANFKEIGIAKTKKQAKQEAAKKMLNRLNDLVPDLESISDSGQTVETMDKSDIQTAKSIYLNYSKLLSQRKINLGVKVADYHILLKNQIDTELHEKVLNELSSLTSKCDIASSPDAIENLKTEFSDILHTIDLNMIEVPVTCSKQMISRCIDTNPEIVEIVIGTDSDAELNLLKKLINALILFLK